MATPTKSVSAQINETKRQEKIADRKRSQAKNILNIGNVFGLSRTQAEEVFKNINANSGAFTEQLSVDDLQRFAASMQERHNEFVAAGIKGGINPRTVVNKSRKIDLQRCQNQIPTALPVRQDKHGTVTFRANASAKSKDTHHIVSVQFLNFQAAISSGQITNKMLEAVIKGAVKFDCDCGRHRYWYRYIATYGQYAYGKPETGFPKIRNPTLSGIACKHVLRVMLVLLNSPAFQAYMRSYIERFREEPLSKQKTLGKRQVEQLKKAIEKENWQGKQVRQHKNARPPKNLMDAFDTRGVPKSLAGAGMNPSQVAAAMAESMTRQQIISRISGFMRDPVMLSTMTTPQLQKLDEAFADAQKGS